MENPVDHTIDLGLINYVRHPDDPDYIVYRFADEERAESFEAALKAENIWYEKSTEERPKRTYTLFGVHKSDFKKTDKINYKVEGMHKKPMIPFKAFRYFIILFGLVAITLAVVGYCKQQDKLASYDENGVLINNTQESE